MSSHHVSQGLDAAQRAGHPLHQAGQVQSPVHPAFPLQAMPWQPTSTRSPRTHLVTPQRLG